MTQTDNAPLDLLGGIEYQDDAVVSRTIVKSDGGNVTLFAFAKGQELSEHTAPFDALVHVLDGEVEIRINQDTSVVETGELLIMPANEPHALKAIRQFKMLLTMIKA
ncbi:cupin domain-containing protein [Candidatus Bipolaricaulota bacterium]